MKYKLTLEIEMPDEETAFRMYAHFVGVPRESLTFGDPGFSFRGACVPSLFTLMQPAYIKVEPLAREHENT